MWPRSDRAPRDALKPNSPFPIPHSPTTRSPNIFPTDPILGNPTAPLAIVEFGDFTCPACAEVETTLAELRRSYGNRLRIIWKDLPILNRATGSRRTHVAARCAQAQGKFWEYHDRMFDEFPQTDGERERVAMSIGLDVERFRSCMEDPAAATLVDANTAEAARLEITATPTFFVNGERMTHTPTIEGFRELLDHRR